MSFDRFDDVARGMASGASRRWLVRTLGAAALGVGGIVGTSRGAQASIEDILGGGDDNEDKDCRRGCLRRCRRQRQRCFIRGRNPFRCQRIDCDDRCCDDDDD